MLLYNLTDMSMYHAHLVEGCDTLGESRWVLPSGPEPQNLVYYELMEEQAFLVLCVLQVEPMIHVCLHYN
jgi:hypothetical protein